MGKKLTALLAAAILGVSVPAFAITLDCATLSVLPLSDMLFRVECGVPPPVNLPPVAVNDDFSGELGQTIVTTSVLANDSDPEGEALSTAPQSNGPFSMTDQGVITYTPTETGTFAFEYAASDPGGLSSNVATVTFTITPPPPPPNQSPVANDDTASGNAGSAITGNVLVNDSDPDGGFLSVQQPADIIQADGSFSFTSTSAGSFSFPYIAIDGQGGSDAANLAITVAAVPPPIPAGLKAFPEAEGYGKDASGGRGGAIIKVTNLNNAGAGSLRACVEATGARNCIFTVAGTISIDSKLTVTSGNLTIAGQTAPGQGIAIKNGLNLDKTFHLRSPNIIIRHIRVRPGPTVTPSDLVNCFGIETTTVMLDHITCSWTTDQNMYVDPSNHITVQDSLFYEGLNKSTHTSAFHSKGTMFIGGGVSLIRNLISANSVVRCPNIEGRNSAGATDYEIRNNVSYNCAEGFFHLYNRSDNTLADMVGNVAIKGPNTKTYSDDFRMTVYPMDIFNRLNVFGPSSGSTVCLQGNLAVGSFPTNSLHGFLNPNDVHLVASTNCYTNPVGRGMTAPAMPAAQTEAYVLSHAGAFPLHRDASDARIAAQVASRTGTIIDNPSQVGGWPVLAQGTPYPDANNDGIDDGWVPNNCGSYANLDCFINQLALTK